MKIDWRLLVLHLIYYVLLLWVYTTYIVHLFGYQGFEDALNINKACIGLFVVIFTFMILHNNGLPSYFFLNMIMALELIPSLVVFGGSDLPFLFITLTCSAFIILVVIVRFVKFPRIRIIRIKPSLLINGLAILSIVFIASILLLGGGKYINFNLTRVYEFRHAAAANIPGIFGYLLPNFSKAIVPLGIALSLFYKKWISMLAFIFCGIMIFALSSNKSPLFVPILIIFVYYVSFNKKTTYLSILALIVLVIISGLDFYLEESGLEGLWGWIGSLGARRTLILPSMLNWHYFEFFSRNPYNFWADSKFSFSLVEKSYDIAIPNVIGFEYYHNIENSANTGWIGSGISQAGYIGVAIYSVLLGSFISFLDAYAKKLGYQLVASIFIMVVTSATQSSDFTTMLLTHGVLTLLFIVMLINPKIK
jgi:hypothetical protein